MDPKQLDELMVNIEGLLGIFTLNIEIGSFTNKFFDNATYSNLKAA